ncbi:MAG: glutamine amidotransferase [Methanospirillaceae archaeon]|nr:glutamine amidotransferase [Methanospirillaceae archaeon]
MSRIMYLYVLDTMSDWEPGYILAELGSGRFFRDPKKSFSLVLCGRNLNPITTMGGIRLVPDICIKDVQPGPDRLLILPGADTWLDPRQIPVLAIIKSLLQTPMTIAAICGATMGLAQAGLFNNRQHTSNDLSALKMFCPDYTGDAYYVDKPAVIDGTLITASGLAPVEFAYQVFEKLEVMQENTREAWYHLHTTRKQEYYYQLIDSLRNSPES